MGPTHVNMHTHTHTHTDMYRHRHIHREAPTQRHTETPSIHTHTHRHRHEGLHTHIHLLAQLLFVECSHFIFHPYLSLRNHNLWAPAAAEVRGAKSCHIPEDLETIWDANANFITKGAAYISTPSTSLLFHENNSILLFRLLASYYAFSKYNQQGRDFKFSWYG